MTSHLERKIAELRHQVDGLLAWRKGSSIVACRVYDDAAQTLGTAALAAIAFAHERWDTHQMHDTSTNNSRIYVPISGWYTIWGEISYAASDTGVRDADIRLDGSTYLTYDRVAANVVDSVSTSALYYLTAGQYLEVIGYQITGGDLATAIVANHSPEFAVARIG